jgi:hypothetical protein
MASIAHSEYDAMAPVVRLTDTVDRCCNAGHHIQSVLLTAGIMINNIVVNPDTNAASPVCFVVFNNSMYSEKPITANIQFSDNTIPHASAAPTPPSNFHHTGQLLPMITPSQ